MKLDSFTTYQRHTSNGLLWVIGARCSYSGRRYLFQFAYDARPEQAILYRLEADQSHPHDRAANYLEDRGNPELLVRRPIDGNGFWLILR